MRRRQLLTLGGSALALTTSLGVAGAEDDVDLRPETGGTVPNQNVPYTETGALGLGPFNQQSKIPVGDWILYQNGIVSGRGAPKAAIKRATNQMTSTFIIDGEEFVLDEFDDWEYSVTSDGRKRVQFNYFIPPKRNGKMYEIRWEIDDSSQRPFGDIFPVTNQIEIVARK